MKHFLYFQNQLLRPKTYYLRAQEISNILRVKQCSVLREKCPYSELFWSAFSDIWTEYGEIRTIFLFSVRMRENGDQYNSEYGHFLRSGESTSYGKFQYAQKPVKTCLFFIYFVGKDVERSTSWERPQKYNSSILRKKQ